MLNQLSLCKFEHCRCPATANPTEQSQCYSGHSVLRRTLAGIGKEVVATHKDDLDFDEVKALCETWSEGSDVRLCRAYKHTVAVWKLGKIFTGPTNKLLLSFTAISDV